MKSAIKKGKEYVQSSINLALGDINNQPTDVPRKKTRLFRHSHSQSGVCFYFVRNCPISGVWGDVFYTPYTPKATMWKNWKYTHVHPLSVCARAILLFLIMPSRCYYLFNIATFAFPVLFMFLFSLSLFLSLSLSHSLCRRVWGTSANVSFRFIYADHILHTLHRVEPTHRWLCFLFWFVYLALRAFPFQHFAITLNTISNFLPERPSQVPRRV